MNYLFVYVIQSGFLLLVTKTATLSVTILSRKQTFRSSLEAVGNHFSFQYSLGPHLRCLLFPQSFPRLSLPAALLTPCIHPNYHTSKLCNCLFVSSPIILRGQSTVPDTCPVPWSLILNKHPINI